MKIELDDDTRRQSIASIQRYFRQRLADLDGACSAPEFGYWKGSGVRRGKP
ncbi:MAG TPA: hypothetical protein VH277_04160 [Gemmatimonadaceae bacterium]|jgi:hypothetical protein|nr:hypothetical protein [Gemmatimonadaceae bacterium]